MGAAGHGADRAAGGVITLPPLRSAYALPPRGRRARTGKAGSAASPLVAHRFSFTRCLVSVVGCLTPAECQTPGLSAHLAFFPRLRQLVVRNRPALRLFFGRHHALLLSAGQLGRMAPSSTVMAPSTRARLMGYRWVCEPACKAIWSSVNCIVLLRMDGCASLSLFFCFFAFYLTSERKQSCSASLFFAFVVL